MTSRGYLLLFQLVAAQSFASEAIPFKREWQGSSHLISYAIVVFILLLAWIVMSKKVKPRLSELKQCKILESTIIGHKTKIHVIDYQGQRFLLADNHQALAIQPLSEVTQAE